MRFFSGRSSFPFACLPGQLCVSLSVCVCVCARVIEADRHVDVNLRIGR
jgi:hypothetical protein